MLERIDVSASRGCESGGTKLHGLRVINFIRALSYCCGAFISISLIYFQTPGASNETSHALSGLDLDICFTMLEK